MEPLLENLKRNSRSERIAFYIGVIKNVIKSLPQKKAEKYADPISILEGKIADFVSQHPGFEGASDITPSSTDEDDEDTDELPECEGGFETGDIISFELGGPDFSEISGALSEVAAEHEAFLLRKHFEYGAHFDYNAYENKVANFFAIIGKGIADLTINLGKGIADVSGNVVKQLGRGFVYTGAGVTAAYASVRQTTSHTGDTKWTHTELALSPKELISAYGGQGVFSHDTCYSLFDTKVIISRFQGDGRQHAEVYKQLVAERAKLWEPYLSHYADTVGEWYPVVMGRCMPFGNAGSRDYFQAVDEESVSEMWNYEPSMNDTEADFFTGVKNKFRTHDGDVRIKPKAMFCSKFVAAVWSSVIGNPTSSPDETVRHSDVNKLFPFNPGACSPWSMAQWLTKSSNKYWKSCIAHTSTLRSCR
jgi:hypothetical protein